MIEPEQLLRLVVVPALKSLDMDSPIGRALVMGTAAQESRLTYLAQIGGGPALGLWQMEPATFRDIHENWLRHRPTVVSRLDMMRTSRSPDPVELSWNLRLGAAMCRIHYRRFSGWPETQDPAELGEYWKAYYNTPQGKGTAEEFAENFEMVRDAIDAWGGAGSRS